MKDRFFRHRSVNGWGLVEDTSDHELRSYVDGHLRSFRYQHRTGHRPNRHLDREIRPSDAAWDKFFKRMHEIGVWDWQDALIEPVCDLGSFRLQLRDGPNALDLSGAGFLPGEGEFGAAVTELCGGRNLYD